MVCTDDIRISCTFLLGNEQAQHVWQVLEKYIKKTVCETWCVYQQPSVSLLSYFLDTQAAKLA